MKRKVLGFFMIFMLMICNFYAKAQQGVKVNGSVIDDNGKPLKRAIISLLHSGNRSLIKADLSDDNGQFEISSTASGSFLLSYSAIGFETYYSPVFELASGQSFTALVVNLKIASKQLQDVTVTSRKPLIQIKAGKTVFNVQNSINATGSSAFELLQKSPGITVDNNDNISVKGKLGVKVYIDGKMIQLTAEDLAAYLKSINSNDIEAIETITNPGAEYDASGSTGIINIRLRKNNNLGTNGSFTAVIIQGITPKANGALNVNYRNRKINIFSNAGLSFGRNETNIIAPRTQKDTTYDQRLQQVSYNKNYNLKAGVDFFINKKQTIGIMNTSNFSIDDYTSYGTTAIYYQPTNNYSKKLDATNEIPKRRTNINTNLNYRYADTSGREINFDADYGLFRGRAKSYQPNYYIDKDNILLAEIITRNSTPTNIDIYTGKLDIVLPKKKNKFGFGVKFSYVKTNNTLDFFNEISGTTTKVPERSYNFIYKENVNAAYATYHNQLNLKWTVRAGLRVEQTNSEGILVRGDGDIQTDNNVKRSYFSLFPSAVLTWTASEKNSFNLSYSRRIDRPNYQTLNPYEMKLDELTYVKGNSFLRPQYTDNVELSHTWKSKVNTSVSYSQVKDFATQTVDTLKNYTYALAKNLATQNISAFSISSPLTITKWWNGFVNLFANYLIFNGKVNENTVSLKAFTYGGFTQHSFALGKDYTAEISGYFNGPAPLSPTLIAKSVGALDIGFQKLLFQKKATIKITATDVFRTSVPFRAGTDFGGLVLNFWVTRESQTARVSFSYRFGSNKIKGARKRESGLETESKRIQAN